MKKKVKKIPKYAEGTVPFYKNTDFYSQIGDFAIQQFDNVQQSKEGVTTGGVAKGTLTGAATGAALGSIIPGIGTAVGAIAGGAIGGITSAIGSGATYDSKSTSTDFNQIYKKGSGIASWFDDEAGSIRGATMVQNANIVKQQTQMLRAKYSMNPNNPVNPIVNAAEGGIMRKPVDALVSKGELIYNPQTKKLSKIPGSNGKPNKKDDVAVTLQEGDMVISNSPTMKMANGKTPAQNLERLVDSNKNIKAKEAIIKKVVNWQEANKTKHHENNKFAKGGIIDPTKLNEAMKKINFAKPKFGTELPDISDKSMASIDKHAAALISSRKAKKAGFDWKNVFDAASNYLPMTATLLKDYDYQRVQPRIGRNFYIPVDYNINDILVDNQQAHAINNYNVSQMGGSTGAYLAAAGQSAANLAKVNSQARIYQKNKQNELIARNITQLNDWERYANNQLWASDVATAQNQGMAQQMEDQARKDRLEFYHGKRNDDMLTAMLKPMFEYGTPDEAYRQIYKRRIV